MRFLERSIGVGACVFLCAGQAHALTVAPAPPRQLINGDEIYYMDSGATLTSAFMDNSGGFYALNFITDNNPGANCDSVSHGTSCDYILFDVKSDQDFSGSSGQPVVTVQILDSSGGALGPVGIGYAGAASGSSLPSVCGVETTCRGGPSAGGYYEAYYTPGSTLRVAVFPKAFCAAYGSGAGCSTVPGSGTKAILKLRVVAWASTTGDGQYSSGGDSKDIEIHIHRAEPSGLSCPATDFDFGNAYVPKDQAITIYMENKFIPTASSSGAPVVDLIGVAVNGGSTTRNSAFRSTNSPYDAMQFSLGRDDFNGFTNTTNGADNLYNVAFMARDASGVTHVPSGCAYTGVQTSEILGFLKKDQCFIATAASGSRESAMVAVFREVRDRVLLQSAFGRRFVAWYYDWSPSRAEWLSRNEWVRRIAYVALLPALWISILLLSGAWGWVGLLAAAAGIGWVIRSERKR